MELKHSKSTKAPSKSKTLHSERDKKKTENRDANRLAKQRSRERQQAKQEEQNQEIKRKLHENELRISSLESKTAKLLNELPGAGSSSSHASARHRSKQSSSGTGKYTGNDVRPEWFGDPY